MSTTEIHAHDHDDHLAEEVAEAKALLSRRRALGLAGVASAGLLSAVVRTGPLGAAKAEAAGTCATLTPSKTIGPYFVEEKLDRSDIRTDPGTGAASAGTKLTIDFTLLNENASCAPFTGAMVDIWHADANGKYSDESSEGTSGKKFLRGYQVSDANGKATFTTIYPGWYSGRAVHIHVRIRTFDSSGNPTYDFLTQMFFDDAKTDTAYTVAPYSSRGTRNTRNANDSIYGSDGAACLMALTGSNAAGYAGTFTFGLQPTGSTSTTTAGTTTGSSTTATGTTTTGSSTTDTTVGVKLVSTKMGRTASGRRIVKVRLRTTERTTIVARIKRGSKVLRRRKATGVSAGTRTYRLPIPARAAGGRATLDLRITDAAGNTKHVAKIVRLPKKKA